MARWEGGDQLVPLDLFDDDYDYFYEALLTEERSRTEAELIVRLAGLRPGHEVLDVPCGDGRISRYLAEVGCVVTGVDASERQIAAARRRAPTARFEVRDMRDLGWRHEFDALVNWFTSFGYFDRDTNRGVLRGFRRALRRGGRLLIEQNNPAWVERLVELGGGRAHNMIERGTDLMVDRLRIVEGRQQVERFIVREGRVRRTGFSVELLDASSLGRELAEAGFGDVAFYDERGEPFGPDSRRMVALAQAMPPAGFEPQ